MKSQHSRLIVLIVVVAAVFRLYAVGGPAGVWHPDENYFVYRPLSFLGGDFNPQIFNYPSFHFYLLTPVYLLHFLYTFIGAGWSLDQWIAYYYFWHPEELLPLARYTSIAFSLGVILLASSLAARVYGARAGPLAAVFLAVGVVHLRQSLLAAVDVPMTFWFLAATYAAMRLPQRERLKDYVLPALFTGLAAATKYPGGLAGGAVLAAHLVCGRSFFDRRLWLAGGLSVCVFLCASPYVALDFSTFWRYFATELGHSSGGHGVDLGTGWWYHLKVTLPADLGWLALVLALLGLVSVCKYPRTETWILTVPFLLFYLAMGSSHAVFVRYALPLCIFQAVLAAGFLQRLGSYRWSLLLLPLALGEPLYGSFRLAQVAAAEDTRTEARRWVEGNVPQGATCCNFGGWFGDVPLATYEGLWWKVWNFERAYPRRQLDDTLEFLAAHRPDTPFYSYVVTAGNQHLEPGALETIDNHDCAYVILHQHPLSYSTVDTAFVRQLGQHAEQVARFTPAGLTAADPSYDPIDAYYLPIGRFGALRQPGPEVQIWKWKETAPEGRNTRRAFAQAYALGAAVRLVQNRLEDSHKMTRRAHELDPDNVEARFVLALIHQQRQDNRAAVDNFRKVLELDPDHAGAYYNLGTIYQNAGRLAQALAARQEFIRLRPRYAQAYYSLGVLYYQLGRYRESLTSSQQGLKLEDSPGFYYNMALAYAKTDRRDEARAVLEALLERTPEDANAHFLLGNFHAESNQREKAAVHYGKVLEIDPVHVRAAAIRRMLESWSTPR